MVGRLLGLPSRFLNFTAVGMSKAESALSHPMDLALMNGVAPVFSFLILGIGSYIWLRSKSAPRRPGIRYFITWLAVFNLPYLGLQMIVMGTASKPNGTGNDFATVFEFFGLHVAGRATLAIAGYIVFILLQIPLSKILYVELHVDPTAESKFFREWTLRNSLTGLFAFSGILLAVLGNYELVLGSGPRMIWIMLEFVAWGISASLFVRWRSALGQALYKDWIIPGLLATIALVPIGLEGNDYLTLWLFALPMICGAAAFKMMNAVCEY